MMSAVILACVYMLPALVAADVFHLGGCGADFDNQLDPMAITQEGINTLKAFALPDPAQLYLWNPSSAEKDFKSMRFTMNGPTFTLDYKDASGISEFISGQATYSTAPKAVLQLDAQTGTKNYWQVFGFNNKGVADLYPLYISKTEVILRGCNEVFLGRRESLYVFTNQNYTSVDIGCAVENIKTMTGWTVSAANNWTFAG